MAQPLMPKATAVWLVDNTTLTFEQIAAFCELHLLEVQAIADGDVATGIVGLDPMANGQLTGEEIERCQKDPGVRLQLAEQVEVPEQKGRRARYTPVSKRGDKPDAIAWILRNCPDISDAQISKLIGTTKSTIVAIRDRTHWNSTNIKPNDPVLLGLCSQTHLNAAIDKARAAAERAAKRAGKTLPPRVDEPVDEPADEPAAASGEPATETGTEPLPAPAEPVETPAAEADKA